MSPSTINNYPPAGAAHPFPSASRGIVSLKERTDAPRRSARRIRSRENEKTKKPRRGEERTDGNAGESNRAGGPSARRAEGQAESTLYSPSPSRDDARGGRGGTDGRGPARHRRGHRPDRGR